MPMLRLMKILIVMERLGDTLLFRLLGRAAGRLPVRLSSITLGLMQLRPPPLRHLTGAVLG